MLATPTRLQLYYDGTVRHGLNLHRVSFEMRCRYDATSGHIRTVKRSLRASKRTTKAKDSLFSIDIRRNDQELHG